MNAVVTGGSGGIGSAIVIALHDAGYEVQQVSRTYGYDLSSRVSRKYIQIDEVDVLVNCAAAQSFDAAADYNLAQWDEDMELNLTAAFDLCQQAARIMIPRGGGKIINIASIAGIQGTRFCIGYSVSKSGLIEMTKCLSNEWAPYNIQVNAIAPGFINAPMLKPLLDDKEHAEVIRGRIPAGRFGKPADVAGAVMFLASKAADYITGITLIVDGGFSAR
jgi:2-deoxy-D-gluconate 3-dehydrogenase